MKDNKGFTLIEVVVSFAILSVVLVYLFKVISVMDTRQTELLREQNYNIYISTVLKKIYSDINKANNISLRNEENTIIFTSDDFTSQNKELVIKDDALVYDNVIYEYPEGLRLKDIKYGITNAENYYVVKIYFNYNNINKEMKIIVIN